MLLYVYFFLGIIVGYAAMITVATETTLQMRIITMTAAGIIGIIIMVFSTSLYVYSVQRKKLKEANHYKEQCIEDLIRQYKQITMKNEELQRQRHDQNAHLNILRKIAESGDLDEFCKYVDELGEKHRNVDYISTGNVIGDAILNEWAEAAGKQGIRFNVAGRFPEGMKIIASDLSSLLSNGVKNACEAAAKCDEEKSVEITIKTFKGKLFLKIKNSANIKLVRQGDHLTTSKTDKSVHGLGTKIMAEIVKKYDGSLDWEYDETGYVITNLEI